MVKEKDVKVKITTDVEDSKVKSLEQELDKLSTDKHDVNIETEKASSKAKSLKSDVDKVDDEQLSVKLDTTNAMVGLQSLKDGFNGLKQAISEIGQQFNQVMASAGKYETNLAYLANNMGLDSAKTKMSEINDIVAKLPGDDTAIGGILSSAAARDSSLTKDNLESIAASAADYMAAMSYYGKTATEAQQDMTNYILTGQTAEIQRSPILANHIDKLKEAKTIQERQKLLAEALNAEGWGGMSQADTYNNKLETFNGMLERGRQNLGLMFMQGSKGAMDFLINLDSATGGLVGMTAAAFGFLEPVGQGLISIGQMGQGIQTLAEGYKKLELGTKLYSAAEKIANGVRKAAKAAQDALNLSMLSNPILLLVAVLAILIGYMIYLYNTNEQCRESVNKLGEDLQRVASGDYSGLKDVGNDLLAASDSFAKASGFAALIGEENYNRWVELRNGMFQTFTDILGQAVEGIMGFAEQVNGAFQQAILSIQSFGNWIGQTFMQVIMTIGQFGMQILQIPVYIAQAIQQGIAQFYAFLGQLNGILGSAIGAVSSFGGNLISGLGSAASSAVSSFASGLSGLVSAAWAEFNDVLSAIADFGAQAVAAAQGIGNQITQAIWQRRSPGIVAQATFAEMKDSKMFLEQGLSDMVDITAYGSDNIIRAYNPNLNTDISNIGTNGGTGSGSVVNNFNFTFTDFIDDKEKLTELIIKTITDEINWNNETANRTV